MTKLFCFGLGYSAEAVARRLAAKGWQIAGTSTSASGAARLARLGYDMHVFDGRTPSEAAATALAPATHVLVSVPPDAAGDPVLRVWDAALRSAPHLTWIGYLSTIGVYGDHAGAWVDEETAATPGNDRSRWRLAAERQWLDFAAITDTRTQIFRLAGIYGPGRSAIDSIRDGTARRIVKPGQVFNRIHVEDIATVVEAAISGHGGHVIYNVTDDEPAPPQDVIAYAAELLCAPVPPEVRYESASLSPMARSFYAENKRVRNERIKADLGVTLAYPTYREGLAAISGKFR